MLPRFAALLPLLLAGCGDGRTPVYPVSGKVMFKGEPLGEGQVVFRPAREIEGVPWPSGPIQADGSYRLTTYEAGDGAPAGDYGVIVSTARSRLGESPLERTRPAPPDPLGGRYNDPDSSGLKATVTEGENTIPTLELE